MLSASYRQSGQGSGDWFSRWPSRLWRRSAATRLLGLRVRIPPGAWMSVSCECCVLSGRGHCEGPTTRREESYRVCVVCVCVCVSLNVIRCNNNPLHLQRMGRKLVRLRKKQSNLHSWKHGKCRFHYDAYIIIFYMDRPNNSEYIKFWHTC
jgi:hypothetical protein